MKLTRPLLALLALLLTLSACYSLAEDITPPPGYEYQPPPQSAPPTDVTYYPLVPPNPTAGAAIFAEKCAPCHGEGGLGNGPEANDLPNPVIPIGDSAPARQSLPGEWYRTVTEGRIDFYMPPFMSLTERQRWDVVAYAYTLSMDTESVALGRERYQAYCADCHGESGRGDGARAAAFTQSVTDFTDQALMSKRSAKDLFEGIAHAAEDVPDFASQVGEDERWALADYLRSLTFASSEELLAGDLNRSSESAPEKIAEPAPDVAGAETKPEDAADDETAASPPEGQDVPDQGSITGQVVNASGVELPSDLGVTLHGYDQFQEVITATTGIDSDGLFNFDGVEMPLGRAFIVTVDYQQNLFTSDVAVVQEGEDTFYMPVSVYESTTGTSGLVIERLHILFELVSPEILRVAELIIISNTTGRVVIAPEEGQPVLEFVLPDGAANLQFQEGTLGEQFIQMASGFGDLRSIAPGESQHQILFSFDMPYNRSLELAQPVDLPVRAVIVLAPDNGIKIK
ncbi:MAG: c-type cytochrome, partial [Anaerolineales bacterium]